MKLRERIPVEVSASAVAHLSVLALVLLLSDVHPFETVAADDTVPVDIVTPQDIEKKPEPEKKPDPEKKPEPTPSPSLDLSPLAQPTPAAPPQPAPQPTAAPPAQKQPAASPSSPPAGQQAMAQPAAPAYTAPQPDISIKYNVQLGLPPALPSAAPAAPRYGGRVDDNFDAPAIRDADLAANVIAEFRRHLRTCSKLPPSLKSSDDVKVTLRVFMTPQGRLADEPLLIEASASEKGPVLMRGAMSALEACQPYTMLPADRYDEWKMLDLSFTPKDFAS